MPPHKPFFNRILSPLFSEKIFREVQNIFPKKIIPLLTLTLLFSGLCIATVNYPKLSQIMHQRFGDKGDSRLKEWQALFDSHYKDPNLQKIKLVNDFFNTRIMFEDDLVVWKKPDYWATPLETLGKGAGDCEDFAIAKYLTLLNLGVDKEKLRLIYVKAQMQNGLNEYQAHMVLGYYETPQKVPLILDNLITEIKSANDRPDLYPIFSFNTGGLWVGNQASQDPTARLSRWRDLLARAQQEGFEQE